MKHPSNKELFAYWDAARGDALAPERSALPPDPVRHLLNDMFVLAHDAAAGYPFRVAGTRTCALIGRDVKGESFTELFAPSSRSEIEDLVGIVSEETSPTIAGVRAMSANGAPAHLELLLLPFSARAHTPLSLTGLLAPMTETQGKLGDFVLTSWRHLEPERQPRGPRILRKWELARGLMVYEGLR